MLAKYYLKRKSQSMIDANLQNILRQHIKRHEIGPTSQNTYKPSLVQLDSPKHPSNRSYNKEPASEYH